MLLKRLIRPDEGQFLCLTLRFKTNEMNLSYDWVGLPKFLRENPKQQIYVVNLQFGEKKQFFYLNIFLRLQAFLINFKQRPLKINF